MPDKEIATIENELSPPIIVQAPRQIATPLVFSSPHSGQIYPDAFVKSSRLDRKALRKSEDAYVDELFAGVVELGAPLIAARFPRAYLDVNREPYELDPKLFRERLPDFANSRSVRVLGGLGTIARVVSESEEIYRERMAIATAFMRIDLLYRPYHAALERLLEQAKARFGYAILIDCHSMPAPASDGASGKGSGDKARNSKALGPKLLGAKALVAKELAAKELGEKCTDIVLGDRFGASCAGIVTRQARAFLASEGFSVAINRPYAGGYITEHYGRPQQGLNSLQIEIARSLYMNEQTLEKNAGFETLRTALTHFAGQMIEAMPGLMTPSAAAE